MFNENETKFSAQDIRFTKKDKFLYTIVMGQLEKNALITSLASNSDLIEGRKITEVKLLGSDTELNWNQNKQGLKIIVPAILPCKHAIVFKISGVIKE